MVIETRLITLFIITVAILSIYTACSVVGVPEPSESNTAISVVMDNNYPPYAFLDEHGNLQGILVDEWKLWEKKTGIPVRLEGLEWTQALKRMENGDYDVIDTIFLNEEREKVLDFSKPYLTVDVPIFFNKNISGITSPSTARGFVIGVKSGDNVISVLKKAGVDQLREFANYQDIVEAAKNGQIMVFSIDKPPAFYYLYRYGLSGDYYQTAPVYSGEFHRAVKKGNTQLLQTLEAGFARITPEEKTHIERKWYGSPLLTPENISDVKVIAAIVLCLILFLLFWNHILHKKVSQKTRELKREVQISNERAEALANSETFLSNIIENIPNMIVVRDAQTHRYICFNKAGEELLGYTWEELNQHTVDDIFEKIKSEASCRPHEQPLIAKQITEIEEEIIHTRYRGNRLLFTKKIPIADEKGEPRYILNISEDITEKRMAEDALKKAQRKLNFLNSIIFTDIQNKLFSLYGFIELRNDTPREDERVIYAMQEKQIIKDIQYLLNSTKDYQNLGLKLPEWKNVDQAFLYGISHLDISHLTRHVHLENLEIFVDPLLEKVFFILSDNIVKHSRSATTLTCSYQESQDGLVIIFEDNGIGIIDGEKEKIFERVGKVTHQMGLFLVKEILGITKITIRETGVYGVGARFEIIVPKGGYRFLNLHDGWSEYTRSNNECNSMT